MAKFIYACDQIRRNLNPDISEATGITGWPCVVAHPDALSVAVSL